MTNETADVLKNLISNLEQAIIEKDKKIINILSLISGELNNNSNPPSKVSDPVFERSVALTLTYLIEGIEIQFKDESKTPQELIGEGHIEYTDLLYEYARIINEVYVELPEKDGPGIFDYEFTGDITGHYLSKKIKNEGELPCHDKFRIWCSITIENWIDGVIRL